MRRRVLLLLLMVSAAHAERSTVSGLVQDSSGGALPGALVVAMNEETGVRYRTRTLDNGIYVLVGVAPGHYKITASRQGFRTLARLHVRISPPSRRKWISCCRSAAFGSKSQWRLTPGPLA